MGILVPNAAEPSPCPLPEYWERVKRQSVLVETGEFGFDFG